MLLDLLELDELEAVEVPVVVLLSESTMALRLTSDAKVADTELPLVQVDVNVPDPDTNLTVAHYRRKRRQSCLGTLRIAANTDQTYLV